MTREFRSRGIACVCDPRGTLLEVIVDDTGLFPADSLGRPLSAFVDPGSAAKTTALFEELPRVRSVSDWELDLRTPGAHPATMNFAAALLGSNQVILAATPLDGDLSALVNRLVGATGKHVEALRALEPLASRPRPPSSALAGLAAVTSEMAELHRELSKKNSELRRLGEDRNRLLGMVAHDLRGPIHAISLAGQALAQQDRDRGEAPSPTRARMLEVIARSTAMMTTLVNDALDLSAIESGRLRLSVERADLAELTERIVEMYAVTAKQKEIAVEVDLAAPMIARVDASKYQQVVGNLVSNALQHCPRGSNVWVSLARDGDAALLSVRDDGPGIAPQRRAALLQRSENPRSQKPAHAGLGLAIAQRLVGGHGGRIELDSALGSGSMFRVWLPLEAEPHTI